MKTIEKIALEYADRVLKPYNLERSIDRITVCDDFIAGVNFAERFIPIKEGLPIFGLVVLVKLDNELVFTGSYHRDDEWLIHYDKSPMVGTKVTHWRPISIK